MMYYDSYRFAVKYDTLRRYRKDEPELIDYLDDLCPLRGLRIAEFGCGTGALTEALAKKAEWVDGFDRSSAMLSKAQKNMQRKSIKNCRLSLADHRAVPLESGTADLAVAAWTMVCIAQETAESEWRSTVADMTSEMIRVVRPGGTIAVVAPVPSGNRRNYTAYLEERFGFQARYFQTSWYFMSRRRARNVIRFFLGDSVWKAYRHTWPRPYVQNAGIWWLLV